MSIQVNTNATAVTWEQLLSSIGDVQKTDSVEGKQAFTITSKVDGETRTVTVSVPDDLEIPEEVDQATLNGLVDKLAATGLGFTDEQIAQMKDAIADMYKALENATSEVAAKSKGHALFDLYALMALLIEVAQSQRDAAREMRTSENIVVQNSIQNQADEQRQAARLGMIIGISCGVASMAVSIGTMIGQSFAASSQSKIMAQSGAESAQLHTNMLQNADNPAHAQQQLQSTIAKVGDGVATEVVGKFESRVNDTQVGNLRGNLNEAALRLDAAKEALPARQAELETAQAQLAEKQAAVDQAQAEYDANPNKAALEAAHAKQQYIREEMSAGRQPSQARIAEFDATIGNAQNDITFSVFLADRFVRGKLPKVSVVVMPNPAFNAHSGISPNVTVQANNCDIAGVRVVYPPRPADASGSAQKPSGLVNVQAGTIDSNVLLMQKYRMPSIVCVISCGSFAQSEGFLSSCCMDWISSITCPTLEKNISAGSSFGALSFPPKCLIRN